MSTPATSSRQRIDWVDYAKGFCIIFVVMMHSTLGVEKAAGDIGWLHAVVQFAKPFRMPDFFLISGLVLGLVITRPWLRYIDRKVIHFAYFYVLWLTIQFVLKAPGWIAEGQGPASVAGEWLFAFIQPFGTLWFIYLLPVFFVVTRVLREIPWFLVFAGAAILEILPIHTGSVIIDEFAARYVYFFAGYIFVARIFDLADWAQRNVGAAVGLIAGWAVLNGVATFVPSPLQRWEMVSDLPVVSLALGAAGAVAVVVATALLARIRWASFLRYLGRHSIVVYLAFFLPMAVSRGVLLKFAPFLDIGTVSLLVTIAGVSGPVILHYLVQRTGFGRFLFERPQWARLERDGPSVSTPRALNPAE